MSGAASVERLDQWVTRQARQRPFAGAVVLGEDRLTYGELEDLSNRLARCLLDAGCEPGDRVCLLMPKSPIAIMAIVAIYKAGGIYVPLDPAGPAPRLAKIIASCEPRWMLAAGPVGGLLETLMAGEGWRESTRVGWVQSDGTQAEPVWADFSARDLDRYAGSPVAASTQRRDPAHIFYTSGSTGVPKGVVITHSNMIAFIEWAVPYFEMRPQDRISGHSPLHFDLSMLDIFGTFAAGAELHLVPPELNVLPNKLAEFIRGSELTQWFSVPSALNYMAKFDVVRVHDFRALRRVMWCGEVLPTPALMYWMRRLPGVRFTNLYGPTETTVASSYYTVPACPEDDAAPVPIGQPCDGEVLYVLDEDLRPVPAGEVGELFIGGVGLSPGYWGDPEKTRAVFLTNPRSSHPEERIYRTGDLARVGTDGLVYFLGRADAQIKSRGYRIELGEIEAALHALGILQEVAVIALPTEGFEGASICCAYVPLPGRSLTPTELRGELSRLLPAYMLPASWLSVETLPTNPNGKIDRRRVAEMFRQPEAARHETHPA